MVHVSPATSDGHQWSARILYTYDIAADGFSVVLSKDEMYTVKKLPGLLSAYGDRQVTVDTTHTFEFLSLNPVTGVRPASDYGEDMIVGMLDSGFEKPAVVFCDPNGGNYAWLKHDSTLVDPHSSNQQLMKFTNAIGFKGKFYALSLQGTLAVIEKIDSHFRITSLGTNRAVPSVHSMHFKEYLIESNGEILLVFLVSRKSIHRVENVEVYRLRFDKLSWVKMESIGDRTLFVGTNWCTSVDASEIGCRLDCIYFSYETADEWWVYDMERGSISPAWKNCDSTTN
ncbi:hypothetical protein RHSIM_Rhsim05G0098900 [Rhododendron simsii]|uniref:DUF295 domain-containing protein n=1 Tax=Rhododendron simsii TaxID=118357 RepID=A0A834GYG7_RHOSS|nr:hypothetical protein RHSIM_Rhsim05G0098900 [Rhododendron simsii]